ncbi:MAG: hypothetical protein CL424_04985 [Acidimicrobiaceae bacterium]|nr:hypothetical protein [Acidimicrobiaceae bacterium]
MIVATRRRTRRGAVAAALIGALVLSQVVYGSPTSAQADEPLPSGTEASTPNLDLVVNVPRQGVNDGVFQSDLAFYGDLAIQGTYGGLNFYDIKHPQKTTLVGQFACPGGQGDPSVSPDGSLVFMSVDAARTDDSCQSSGTSTANPDGWEGIRIVDISDPTNAQQVATVRTDCGSHTHTLVPGATDDVVYLYISSYGPNAAFPNCQPPHDAISIVEVPIDDPASASVVNKAVLFPDGGAISRTAGCHDITVYPELDLAAGACMGEGVLMDISDPVAPYVITSVTDTNFAFWHSATFSNDATKVVFTDELGGGGGATCNEAVGPERGANAIFTIVGEGDDRTLEFQSYFKIPRHQANTENCVAHNGSIVPSNDRDLMVQSWYQGGVLVMDFTDPANPFEIAWFDRGALDPPALGGSWSAYWYNGYIYSSDITLGLDVLRLTGTEGVSSANRVKQDHFNAQTQYRLKD